MNQLVEFCDVLFCAFVPRLPFVTSTLPGAFLSDGGVSSSVGKELPPISPAISTGLGLAISVTWHNGHEFFLDIHCLKQST
jgi:hypothetical protein